MKPLIRSLMFVLAALALVATTGCQTVATSTSQEIGAPNYPPSNPALVQILRTEPTRAHVRLGRVQAGPSDPSVQVTKFEEALRKAGAKIGADAVVVIYDQTQVTGAQVVGGWMDRSIQRVEGRVVMGIAIKYQ
jgi:hypothetical protein